jgi:PKD repeat protein
MMKRALFSISILLPILFYTACTKKKPRACLDVPVEVVRLGDSLTFTSCSENTESYKWEFEEGVLVPGGATITHQMNRLGYNMISLWAYNGNEYAVAQQAVTVTDAKAQICPYDTFLQVNQYVDFNNCSQGAQTYLWNYGDGITDTSENGSHAYTAGGFYTITLTSTVAGGYFSAMDSIHVVVVHDRPRDYTSGNYYAEDDCGLPPYLIGISLLDSTITLHNLGNYDPPIDIQANIDTSINFFHISKSVSHGGEIYAFNIDGNFWDLSQLRITYAVASPGAFKRCNITGYYLF